MKMKSINRVNKSDSIYENLAHKSLGNAKLKLCHSDRRSDRPDEFFADLPELIRLDKAASVLGISIKTIYDWRYRCKQRKIPPDLFVKLNRTLLIRTHVLKEWIASQNPSLEGGRN